MESWLRKPPSEKVQGDLVSKPAPALRRSDGRTQVPRHVVLSERHDRDFPPTRLVLPRASVGSLLLLAAEPERHNRSSPAREVRSKARLAFLKKAISEELRLVEGLLRTLAMPLPPAGSRHGRLQRA